MAEINNVNYFNYWKFDKSDRREKGHPNESLHSIKNNTVKWIADRLPYLRLDKEAYPVFTLPSNGRQPGPSNVNGFGVWMKILTEGWDFLRFSERICCICSLEELLCWIGAPDRGRLSTRPSLLLGSLLFIWIQNMTAHVKFKPSRPCGEIGLAFSDLLTVWFFSSEDTAGRSAGLQVWRADSSI